MTIEFRCQACGKSLRTNKPDMVGKRVRCPGCQGVVVVKPADQGEAIQPPQKSGPPPMPPQPERSAVERPRRPRPPADPFEDEGPPPDMPRAPRRGRPSSRPQKGGLDAVGMIVGVMVCVYIAAMTLVLLGVVGAAPKVVVANANGPGPGPFDPGPIQPEPGPGPIEPKPKEKKEPNNGKPLPKKDPNAGKPLPPPSPAGKPISIKGQAKIGEHEVLMNAGTLYIVRVVGEGFRPNVYMHPNALPYQPSPAGQPHQYESNYVPTKTETQTIRIAPDIFDVKSDAEMRYTLSVLPLAMDAKPLLEKQESLTNADPPYKARFANRVHHKAYPIKLEAGKYYMIDLKARGNNAPDCYLHLIDSKDKEIMRDDDGGGFPNARLVLKPMETQMYRIIATGLGDALGDFTLTVRVEDGAPSKEKGLDVKGTLTPGAHQFSPVLDQLNLITVKGEKFRPQVRMRPGTLPLQIGPASTKPNSYQNYYMAEKANETQSIFVVPHLYSITSKDPCEYTLNITPVALSNKPMIDVKDELTNADPPIKLGFSNRKHHKAYPLKLEFGKYYVGEMRPQRRGDFLTCSLVFLDGKNKIVATSSGFGGGNARVIFQAPWADTFRLIASVFGNNTGAFELRVREQAK